MSSLVASANVRLRPPSLKVETFSVPMRSHLIDGRQELRCLRVMAPAACGLRSVLLRSNGTDGGDGTLGGEAAPRLGGRGVGGACGP